MLVDPMTPPGRSSGAVPQAAPSTRFVDWFGQRVSSRLGAWLYRNLRKEGK